MTNTELAKYWIDSSDEDYDVMMTLYNGEKYSWCLFVGHIVIEKLVKGIYAKNNEESPHAPKIHNLVQLADKCELDLDQKQRDVLALFTKFNMSARYDDYKKEFYNKCTREYAEQQINNIEEMRIWLKAQLI